MARTTTTSNRFNPIRWAFALVVILVFAAVAYRISANCEPTSLELFRQLKVNLGGCTVSSVMQNDRIEVPINTSVGTLVARIESGPGPVPGKPAKASAHFSTESAEGAELHWRVLSRGEENPEITFSVKKSKVTRNTTIFPGLRNGAVTSLVHDDNLYIANPVGAYEKFVVEVYAK